MNVTRILGGVFSLFAVFSTAAVAQDAVIAPINNWSYQRHSSTPIEGFLRGSAAVVQAQGQKNYLDSIAIVNYQTARRKAIENSKLYVQTYFENKDTIIEHRKKYAPLPPTKEQWARILEKSLPDRLTVEQYDPSTGSLVWPHILRWDEYKAIRERIDVLLAQRTPDNSGDGSPSQREVAVLLSQMEQLLRTNDAKVTIVQYGNAKRFLRSLSYEMQLPMTNVAPAN